MIKQLFIGIGKFLRIVWPISLSRTVGILRTFLYTGYIKKQFRHFGKGSIIEYKAMKIRGEQYISIGDNVSIEKDVQLKAWGSYGKDVFSPEIIIGNNCVLRAHAHISAIKRIEIGDGLLTGTNVLIIDNAHGLSDFNLLSVRPNIRPLFSKGPVKIGKNVWLGNNVCVMPGVTVGDGVIVGANSVVTNDIPSYSVAGGSPAKVIKKMN